MNIGIFEKTIIKSKFGECCLLIKLLQLILQLYYYLVQQFQVGKGLFVKI